MKPVFGRRHRLGRRGGSAVEFAVLGALFFMVVLASLEAARFFVAVNSVRTVVAQAGRAAMFNASLGSDSNAIYDAANAGAFVRGGTITIQRRTTTSPIAGQEVVQVTVTYTGEFRFLVNVFGLGTVPVNEMQVFEFAT